MNGVGQTWQIAALDFVLSLGSCLDERLTLRDGALDQLIVTKFKVKPIDAFKRAPIASINRRPTFEGEGHGDDVPVAPGRRDKCCIPNRALRKRKPARIEVGTSPFSGRGVLIESTDGGPIFVAEAGAVFDMNFKP